MNLVVDGRTVHVYTGARAWRDGDATVVFVHGAGNDHSVWALQSRYVAHHGRNVLAVDLPGHGRSEGAPLERVEDIADWIVALLDAAGVGTAALVGHSMGALAVLESAARKPDRVSRVVLIGPAVPMQVSADLLDAAENDEALAYALINGWSFGAHGQLGGNAWPGVWMSGNALRLLERNRPRVLAHDLVACQSYANGLAAAAKVRCPALLVLGGRDVMAHARDAQPLIEALSDKQIVMIDGAGHALMAEEPDRVLDALRPFLEIA